MESDSNNADADALLVLTQLSLLARHSLERKETALDVLNASKAGERTLTDQDVRDYYGEYQRQREEGELPDSKMRCSAPDKIAARYALNLRLTVIFPVGAKKALSLIRSIYNDAQIDALLELSEEDFRTEVSALVTQRILDKLTRLNGISDEEIIKLLGEKYFEEHAVKFLTASESQMERLADSIKLLID